MIKPDVGLIFILQGNAFSRGWDSTTKKTNHSVFPRLWILKKPVWSTGSCLEKVLPAPEPWKNYPDETSLLSSPNSRSSLFNTGNSRWKSLGYEDTFTSHPFNSSVTLDSLLTLFESLHLLNGPTEVLSLSTSVFFQQFLRHGSAGLPARTICPEFFPSS